MKSLLSKRVTVLFWRSFFADCFLDFVVASFLAAVVEDDEVAVEIVDDGWAVEGTDVRVPDVGGFAVNLLFRIMVIEDADDATMPCDDATVRCFCCAICFACSQDFAVSRLTFALAQSFDIAQSSLFISSSSYKVNPKA